MSIAKFERAFFIGILVAIASIFIGWVITPSENVVGVIAAITILIGYAAVAWISNKTAAKIDRTVSAIAIRIGLLAGAIFAGEIILEYILLPNDNTIFGLVEFGGVFFLFFLSGLVTAYGTRSIRSGIFSAVWTAMIATLIWAIFVLGTFYLFHNTSRQNQVFQAEGNFADFARSGESNFDKFIMEDFMGAVSYHSLLTPIIAAGLGLVGAAIGKFAAKIKLAH